LIDPFGKYKLNNYLGDTLAIDIEQEFKLEGFDLVVGNPPYNDELKSTGASPLYHKFIYKYELLTKQLQFIVPSRWFAGGKGLADFRVWMKSRTDIVYIKHYTDSKQVFGSNVEIKGGVDHFLINKDYNGLCLFNDTLINLDKYDIIVQESKYYKLIDRIIYKLNILQLYKPQQYYGIKSNDNRLVDKAEVDQILVYVSKQKGFKKYIDKKYIDVDVTKWKVITARASHEGNSSFGNKFIGKPNECHSQSYISFEVKNEVEAKSLLSYLQCKLPNLLLSVRKLSQDICADTCKWIPLVPLDRIWSDEQLFEYFKFSKELISLVKAAKIIGWK
jgi:site-specific DNA-methyltransferase (adenine-specific)